MNVTYSLFTQTSIRSLMGHFQFNFKIFWWAVNIIFMFLVDVDVWSTWDILIVGIMFRFMRVDRYYYRYNISGCAPQVWSMNYINPLRNIQFYYFCKLPCVKCFVFEIRKKKNSSYVSGNFNLLRIL